MAKILEIESCFKCPYYFRLSDTPLCQEANKKLDTWDKGKIPEWCPLEEAGDD